jgi:hypothetical protein
MASIVQKSREVRFMGDSFRMLRKSCTGVGAFREEGPGERALDTLLKSGLPLHSSGGEMSVRRTPRSKRKGAMSDGP